MKRYLIFAGASYYPCGGWKDLVADSDNLETAKDYIIRFVYSDWVHIVDTKHGEIVFIK